MTELKEADCVTAMRRPMHAGATIIKGGGSKARRVQREEWRGSRQIWGRIYMDDLPI
jgi:hypothetical protein